MANAYPRERPWYWKGYAKACGLKITSQRAPASMHLQEMNDDMKACAFFSSDTIPKGGARDLRAVGVVSKAHLTSNDVSSTHPSILLGTMQAWLPIVAYATPWLGCQGRDDGHVSGGTDVGCVALWLPV